MKTGVMAAVFAVVVVVVLGGGYLLMSLSYKTTEVQVKNGVLAQQKSCEAYFDKMWKVISQKAQITDQYKEAFKEIYPALMAGRYGNEKGGSLMKWIQESNPNFDVSLYKDLMASVEAERAGFFREQQKLIDLNREHDNLLEQPVSGFFLKGKAKIEIVIVTSDRTAQAFATGKDNDVDLFKNK
jgi:hypothetical protein